MEHSAILHETRVNMAHLEMEALHQRYCRAIRDMATKMRPGGVIADQARSIIKRSFTTTEMPPPPMDYDEEYDSMFFEDAAEYYFPSGVCHNLRIPPTPVKHPRGGARIVCTTDRKMHTVLGGKSAMCGFMLRVVEGPGTTPGEAEGAGLELVQVCKDMKELVMEYREIRGFMDCALDHLEELGVVSKRSSPPEGGGMGFFVKRQRV